MTPSEAADEFMRAVLTSSPTAWGDVNKRKLVLKAKHAVISKVLAEVPTDRDDVAAMAISFAASRVGF